jgi:hypothetical protein
MKIALLVCSLGILLSGCTSSKSGLTETVVTGKVTLDGVTLTMGEVIFENEAGTLSGRGEIQSDGQYRIPSAPLGKVKVAVRTSNYAQYAKTQTKGGKALTVGGREGTFLAVPKKYEDVKSSGISFDVFADKPIEIPLTSR